MAKMQHRKLEEIQVSTDNWLTLNDLRELVAEADRLGWIGSSLISHGEGNVHPTRAGAFTAQIILIEGGTHG